VNGQASAYQQPLAYGLLPASLKPEGSKVDGGKLRARLPGHYFAKISTTKTNHTQALA